MEKITEFVPAHDHTSKGGGLHGVELRMVLKGEIGAVQFVVYTNWQLPHVTKKFRAKMSPETYFLYEPMPADLGYHSKVPTYEGQSGIDRCPYIESPDGVCYYDGSTLHAQKVYDILLEKGSGGVWDYLEQYYEEVFGELK